MTPEILHTESTPESIKMSENRQIVLTIDSEEVARVGFTMANKRAILCVE